MRTINFVNHASRFDVADISLMTGLTISELMINSSKHYMQTCKAVIKELVSKELAKDIYKNIKKGKLTNVSSLGKALYVAGALSSMPSKDVKLAIKDLLVKYLSAYYNKRADKYGHIEDSEISSLLDICGEVKIKLEPQVKQAKKKETKSENGKKDNVIDNNKVYNKLNKIINLKSIKKDVVSAIISNTNDKALKALKAKADSLAEGQRFYYNKKDSDLSKGLISLQGVGEDGNKVFINIELPKAKQEKVETKETVAPAQTTEESVAEATA